MPSTLVRSSSTASRSAATRAIWRMRIALLAAELRGALFEERREPFLRIGRAAHFRNRTRLHFHLGLEPAIEGAEQQPLRRAERERRTGGQLRRDLARFGVEVGGGHDLVDEAPFERFRRAEHAVPQHEVTRTRETDAARK